MRSRRTAEVSAGAASRRSRHPTASHGDVKVDAIQQRTGELARVAQAFAGLANARAPRISEEAARTRIHRGDEKQVARKDQGPRGPHDRNAMLLERLPDGLQDVAPELRQLVEEQHAAVREGRFAGRGAGPAPDQTRRGNPVVGCPKRRVGQETGSGRERARDRMDLRDLDRLRGRKRRKNPGKPSGEHRLSGSGRSRKQQVVAPRGADLGGAAGDELSPDFREVRKGSGWRRRPLGHGGSDRTLAQDVRHRLAEVGDRDHADASDRGGFGGVCRGEHDLLEPRVTRGDGEAERAPDGPDLAAEAELADEDAPRSVGCREAGQAEQPERHGKIERGAAFPEVRRGEVDGDGPVRYGKPPVLQRRTDALPRLPHARVGKTDDGEARKAVRGVDLDVEHAGFETQSGRGVDPSEHDASSAEEGLIG